MSEDNAAEAVVLLRVPEWDAGDDVDVRFLEDGALVFLPLPFDADPGELLQEIVDQLGDVVDHHDDERGVFIFPDVAEPDDAETYEAVIAAVGDAGKWIGSEPVPLDPSALLGEGGAEIMGHMLETMGISDPKAFMEAMRSGDPDAMKLAQVQLHGKLEEAMRTARGEAPPTIGVEAEPTKEPDKK